MRQRQLEVSRRELLTCLENFNIFFVALLGYRSCLECDNENDNITITNVDNESAIAIPFTFDAVYDTDSLQ